MRNSFKDTFWVLFFGSTADSFCLQILALLEKEDVGIFQTEQFSQAKNWLNQINLPIYLILIDMDLKHINESNLLIDYLSKLSKKEKPDILIFGSEACSGNDDEQTGVNLILEKTLPFQLIQLVLKSRLELHRYQQQSKLNQLMLENLKNQNQIKAALLAKTVHDLQGPLTPLEGYLELFLSGELSLNDHEQVQAVFETMLSGVQRLRRDIEHIRFVNLAFGQMLAPEPTIFAFHDLLLNLKQWVARDLVQREMELALEYQTEKDEIQADVGQVTQALFACLEGAIQIAHRNSCLSIQVKYLSSQRLIDRTTQNLNKKQYLFAFLPDNLNKSGFLEFIVQVRCGELNLDWAQLAVASWTQLAANLENRELKEFILAISLAIKVMQTHQACFYLEVQPHIGLLFSFIFPLSSASEDAATAGRI